MYHHYSMRTSDEMEHLQTLEKLLCVFIGRLVNY